MKMFRMCLNWRVIAGLAAIGAGIFVFTPNLAGAALPFLVLAICPLSMVLMMAAMNNMNGPQEGTACAVGEQGKKLSQEEQVAQLKAQQAALASQIAVLEEQ